MAVIFCWKFLKIFEKNLPMKYIGQCLVNCLDPTNMPNFCLKSMYGSTTPKKKPKVCYLFLILKKLIDSDS